MFTKTLVILFNILFALTLAAPSPHNTNTTTAISSSFPNLTPRDCNPNGYGCSECSECCLLTYTSSKELGCGALGDPQQPLYGVAKPDGGCQNLFIGMYAAKVGECTGFFDSCVLWSEQNCKGIQTTLWNDGGSCAAPFLIKSVQCHGGGVPGA